MTSTKTDAEVRTVLEEWAEATRQSRRDEILKHHSAKLVIFDVLPPMKYESAVECGFTLKISRRSVLSQFVVVTRAPRYGRAPTEHPSS
jgi:ketosteroid isomerase-like protein